VVELCQRRPTRLRRGSHPPGRGGWFASSTTRRRSRQGLGPGPSG